MSTHGGDDGLQIVLVPAAYSDLLALDLRGHLQFGVADELRNRGIDGLIELLATKNRQAVRTASAKT